MGLMSRMNAYIKTLCSNFMIKSLVFNLLWIFKVVQKHHPIKDKLNGLNTP